MPTPEEIAAEKAAKEAADKKAAEEAEAKKKAEEEAAAKSQQDFETWLAGQPKEVQERYAAHTAGLKSALDKEREAAKTNAQAAKELEKIKAEAEKKRLDEMSEVERLKTEKGQAEAEAKRLKLAQMRRDAADKAGLPHEFAERLKGETPEELEADAKRVKELIPEPKKPQQPPIKTTAPGPDGTLPDMTDAQKSEFLWGKRQ